MADSVFLDEVVGFLHNIDDPTVSGAELLLSLDKDGPLLSLPDTDIAFQLLDVSPIDGLFSSSEDDSKDHHSAATDSDCASYRQKRKAEKAELYKEVEELSTQLADLQIEKELSRPEEVWVWPRLRCGRRWPTGTWKPGSLQKSSSADSVRLWKEGRPDQGSWGHYQEENQ
ncbi:hypothetical protein GQ600_16578 [Phytophthora cactorum]|nr:hypothetical protein GQ600_16578 [Phytophthora cactorum]